MTSISIKPIGSYLNVDGDGFIINPTSVDKIQPEWLPAVERVREAYREHFGDALHSVYIRGSVAKGEAMENISDIDSFAFVSLPHEKINSSWFESFTKELLSQYPFITGIELHGIPLEELKDHRGDRIMIKTQSICVYGKNLADKIAPLKPGKDTAQHIKNIQSEIAKTKEWLNSKHTDEGVKQKCTWIMKRILRSGFELVMERSQKYTRDLYRCYEGFAEYYPDKKDEMYRVLELAINPVSDTAVIDSILSGIEIWIGNEIALIF